MEADLRKRIAGFQWAFYAQAAFEMLVIFLALLTVRRISVEKE